MRSIAAALAVTVFAAPGVLAQDAASPAGAPAAKPAPAKIQWFGTWAQGLAEAGRTGRPILLTSAAPQCHGVPGLW